MPLSASLPPSGPLDGASSSFGGSGHSSHGITSMPPQTWASPQAGNFIPSSTAFSQTPATTQSAGAHQFAGFAFPLTAGSMSRPLDGNALINSRTGLLDAYASAPGSAPRTPPMMPQDNSQVPWSSASLAAERQHLPTPPMTAMLKSAPPGAFTAVPSNLAPHSGGLGSAFLPQGGTVTSSVFPSGSVSMAPAGVGSFSLPPSGVGSLALPPTGMSTGVGSLALPTGGQSPAMSPTSDLFGIIDTNKDGRISREEFRQAIASIQSSQLPSPGVSIAYAAPPPTEPPTASPLPVPGTGPQSGPQFLGTAGSIRQQLATHGSIPVSEYVDKTPAFAGGQPFDNVRNDSKGSAIFPPPGSATPPMSQRLGPLTDLEVMQAIEQDLQASRVEGEWLERRGTELGQRLEALERLAGNLVGPIPHHFHFPGDEERDPMAEGAPFADKYFIESLKDGNSRYSSSLDPRYGFYVDHDKVFKREAQIKHLSGQDHGMIRWMAGLS